MTMIDEVGVQSSSDHLGESRISVHRFRYNMTG
jgi:hypothetical protein